MAISLESRCHATLNREACQRSVASVELMKKMLLKCTKLYEIAVRRCTKCCTKLEMRDLHESSIIAIAFENKGYRAFIGVRSRL